MSDGVPSTRRNERDLAAIGRLIWNGKLIIAGLALAAVLLAIVHLNRATYLYTAQLKVVAAGREGSSGTSSRLGSLAAIAGVSAPGANDLTFILYKQGLQSRDVAEVLSGDPQLMRRIFAGEWDARTRRWTEPQSLRASLTSGVKRMMGLPVYPWVAPDAARLQQYLQSRIEVSESANSPIVTVQFSDPDPAFAVEFLSLLSQTVDRTVRRKTLRKTGDYIAYVSQKLAVVTLAEHRASLAATLAEQERQRMTASSAAPFAAEPIDRVVVSTHPTSPKPSLVLGAALLAGLLLGASVVLLLDSVRRPASP